MIVVKHKISRSVVHWFLIFCYIFFCFGTTLAWGFRNIFILHCKGHGKNIDVRCTMAGLCGVALESSWGELQDWFRICPDRRSGQEVMMAQNPNNPNWDSFRTPLWESRDKQPLGCGRGGATQSILYGGRWWLPPSPSCGESSESKVTRGLS